MKSLRGMPASRTQIVMICFSRLRISATLSRSCWISASNIFGESFSSMNSPASFLRSFCVFGSLRPFSSQRLERLLVELRDRDEAARRFFRIRAGLEHFLVFRVLLGSSSSSVSSAGAAAAAAAASFGFTGAAISSGAFGSMKPTMMSTSRPWPALTCSYWRSMNSKVIG